MAVDFIVNDAAEADVAEVVAWYRDRSVAAAVNFERSLDLCLNSIQNHPELYAVVWKGTRAALLRRYPYCVFYKFEGNLIEVIAVVHGSRHSRLWRRRV